MPKKPTRAGGQGDLFEHARQVTSRKPARRVVTPDPDYVSDLEASDGQRMKRMADRARSKPVKRPQPR